MTPITQAAERMRRHKAAISGEQTTFAFSKSPYFLAGALDVPGRQWTPGDWWEWDTEAIAADTRTLADAYLEEHPE